MASLRQYEDRILKELRTLPEEALPKVLRLITFMREEFLTRENPELPKESGEKTSHEKTRHLLATSKGNWAQEIIAEREDRL